VPTGVSLKTTVITLTVVQIVWLGLACWQIGSFVHSNSGEFSVADIRLAIILNAIAFLTSRLIDLVPPEHRLSKLSDLRQNIAFGKISSAAAAADAEALLTGVTLREIMQPLINTILAEEQRMQSVVAETERALDRVERKLSSHDQLPGEVLQMIDSIGTPPTGIVRQIKNNKRAWSRFIGQTIAFTLYLPESKLEAKAIADDIREKLEDVKSKLSNCLKRYDALKTQVHLEATSAENRLIRQLG